MPTCPRKTAAGFSTKPDDNAQFGIYCNSIVPGFRTDVGVMVRNEKQLSLAH
jgi:hypothetical protein